LTMDTLAFGYILPTTGRIPDLHRLETCAAGRTKKADNSCTMQKPSAVISGSGNMFTTTGDLIPGI
ncbi:MAG: hypothetical protein KH325_07320, partial [Hungatella hathewayi]|nr:hypothetical protein [Hungatella hathewayi]